MPTRCFWANTDDPLYQSYHDQEWGVPVHDDRLLFEFLILEGAQAGLSWYTILRKRPNYHLAFDDFDPHKIARYDDQKVSRACWPTRASSATGSRSMLPSRMPRHS